MGRLRQWYDHLIFEEYRLSPEALGLFRVLYAGLGMFLIGYSNVLWLDLVPDYFYRPQLFNLAHFLTDRMPPYWVLFLLSWLPAVCLVSLLFGYRSKIAALGFGLLLILSGAFTGSLGKIDHGILYPLTAIIMAFSGWERKYSLEHGKTDAGSARGLAPFLLALVLGFAFFTAGFAKLTGGWLSPDRVGVLHHYFGSYEVWERRDLLAPVFQDVRSMVFWKGLDYGTVAFEVFFLPAVLNRRVFGFFILLAIVFHSLVFLILNITITSIFLVYALFLPWEKLTGRLRKNPKLTRKIGTISGRKSFIAFLLAISIAFGAWLLFHPEEYTLSVISLLLFPFGTDYRMVQTLILYALVWIMLIGWKL